MNRNLVSIRVWGDFACFTRPEMKVERVSYPVMTPSAARGVLEAIFWEPEMFYLIDSVRVIKKGLWVSFRRNEVTEVVRMGNLFSWMKDPSSCSPIQAGGGAKHGTQRNMLALETVEYIITAEVGVTTIGAKSNQAVKKYTEEVERRARAGKCYHRPALGMREFAADFEYEPNPDQGLERRARELYRDKTGAEIWPEDDLGLMLYDVFNPEDRLLGFRWFTSEVDHLKDQELRNEKFPTASKVRRASDKFQKHFEGEMVKPSAVFFHGRIKNSKLECNPRVVKLIANTSGDSRNAS